MMKFIKVKFKFKALLIILPVLLMFPITVVLADDTFSKVEGVLIKKESNRVNEKLTNDTQKKSSKQLDKVEKIPHLGEGNTHYSLKSGFILIAVGILLLVKKRRNNGYNAGILVISFVTVLKFFSSLITPVDASVFSSIKGEIVGGDFVIEQPNNIRFNAQLNDQSQIIQLPTIHTIVKDYRGLDEGWQVTLQSADYQQYKENFALIINNTCITNEASIIFEESQRSMKKNLIFNSEVEISANAVAGSYIANLEWNLQPNTKKTMNE
ncbi:hypothetical protein [Brochothrix thermosphacta]|uniref:hypothetical protein n=1 Tax=Brochothrix thermosphacta TaxID=2756 RepID=UPI000EBA9B32|nr:hypothetical protein [Brochothrix thermosphacta]HCZ39664.1 hypothetical protein [Brochothrix thermosphacta]HCZ45491.1 hypothetical protein [Brochothrix thermosphacta]